MAGGRHATAKEPSGGRGQAVVGVLGVVVVVAAAALLYDRVVAGDEPVADLSDAELEAALLTLDEVSAVASEGRRSDRTFEARTMDEALAQLIVDTSEAGPRVSYPECERFVDQVVPGASDASAAAAYQAADGSLVLHTLTRLEDGDLSGPDLVEWADTCSAGGLEGSGPTRLLPLPTADVDLGDVAFQQTMSVELSRSGGATDMEDRYLTTVVVERDGLVATVTVVRGDGSAPVDESELARLLAEEADAELAARL